jgi:hypothetical protein
MLASFGKVVPLVLSRKSTRVAVVVHHMSILAVGIPVTRPK